MTIGYGYSGIEKIHIPKGIRPLIIDDFTLAFFLGFRNKSLWYALHCKEDLYRKFYILKSDKVSKRAIHEPLRTLKHLLNQMHSRLLLPLQEGLGDHVIAYRTGRSIANGIKQHIPKCKTCDSLPAGQSPKRHDCPRFGTYIHMDLKDFFHNTTRAYIRNYFIDQGYSFYVSGLMANLMTVDDLPHPLYEKSPTRFPKYSSGVPQGAPTSGAICNLVADHRIDGRILDYMEELNELYKLKDEWGWVYSRYADDITITCGIELLHRRKMEVVKKVTSIIKEGGYRVNYDKTQVTSAYHRRTLGLLFHQKLNVPKHVYLNTRALVHNCRVHGFESQLEKAKKESTDDLIQYVRGKVNYINQVHEGRGTKLLEEFDAAMVIHNGGINAQPAA